MKAPWGTRSILRQMAEFDLEFYRRCLDAAQCGILRLSQEDTSAL